MSLIRKHGAVLQAWACLDLVLWESSQTISELIDRFKILLQSNASYLHNVAWQRIKQDTDNISKNTCIAVLHLADV